MITEYKKDFAVQWHTYIDSKRHCHCEHNTSQLGNGCRFGEISVDDTAGLGAASVVATTSCALTKNKARGCRKRSQRNKLSQ